MKNASIRVNVEKQIPNVGLRLFCQPLSRIFGTNEIFYGPQQALRGKSQRLMNVFHLLLQALFAR
jgi:hypothetical protein